TAFTTNGTSGGTWSSDNETVATVNSSGVVLGVAEGTANITYTVNNGCGSPVSSTPKQITVTTCATPTITCPGDIITNATSGCSVNVSTPDPTVTNATSLT